MLVSVGTAQVPAPVRNFVLSVALGFGTKPALPASVPSAPTIADTVAVVALPEEGVNVTICAVLSELKVVPLNV